jgi:beta-mannosidase
VSKRLYLDGDDWILTGWWKNQFRATSSGGASRAPAPIAHIAGTVPGAVQVDLEKAGLLKDLNIGSNAMCAEWVNNREWTYEKEFELPRGFEGERYYLNFEGLDYSGEIYLNGDRIFEFEGMFLPVSLDVTERLKLGEKNELIVFFEQSPEIDGQYGYSSKIRHLKSRFNYIWDWCTRIVPVGIWKSVYLEIVSGVRCLDFWPNAVLKQDNKTGVLDVSLEIDVMVSGEYTVVFELNGEFLESINASWNVGRVFLNHILEMKDIKPWWPRGFGDQNLYDIVTRILDNEGREVLELKKRVGFKRMESVRNPGSPETSRPYTIVVNGRRVFLKGINWVPISPFYGAVTREDYERYIGRFESMNCNILRVWGGAILEHTDFYDVCDEKGLLVWQEFPQSSSGIDNTPPSETGFLKELREVARTMIRARRHHASLVIWCGGNELMEPDWTPVTEEHPNIGMLRDLVCKLDPDKLFFPTSPSGPIFSAHMEQLGTGIAHEVHGSWEYLGPEEHYIYYNEDDSLMRSEVGTAGASNPETIRKAAGVEPVWPANKDSLMWRIHANWWIDWDRLTELFGMWNENEEQLDEYSKASQYLQAESIRYVVESVMRRVPKASGVLIWMGNEPYANFCNTSLIQYDGVPKPAYDWVRQCFEGVHVSCKYDKVCFKRGEEFKYEVFVHKTEDFDGHVEVEAQIFTSRGLLLNQAKWVADLSNTECPICVRVGGMAWIVKELPSDMFLLRIIIKHKEFEAKHNDYVYFTGDTFPMSPLRKMDKIALRVSDLGTSDRGVALLEVENISSTAAVMVYLRQKNPDSFLGVYPNNFVLLPGESRKVEVTMSDMMDEETVLVSAFNMEQNIEIKVRR